MAEKKTLLLIEDDQNTAAAIAEAVGGKYFLEVISQAAAAIKAVGQKAPHLILLDFDLAGSDGLQVYRSLKQAAPQTKVIMLSLSNNIPLAVTAAKLGVADFLRKPVEADQLLLAIEKTLAVAEGTISWATETIWLKGESRRIREMHDQLKNLVGSPANLLLFAETGIAVEEVAAFIHQHGPKRKRDLKIIDLSSFRRENLETHFWTTVQEIMGEVGPNSVRSEEERCGTLYLGKIETLEESFRLSIFDFFKERREKVDRDILVIIGISDRPLGETLKAKGYNYLAVPAVRERKEDLLFLIRQYLRKFSLEHRKKIAGLSPELLDFLSLYDYPGNYEELANLLEQAVLMAQGDKLTLKELSIGFAELASASIKGSLRDGALRLDEAKGHFEKLLIEFLLAKTAGDIAATARFLEIPKTVLAEKIENSL